MQRQLKIIWIDDEIDLLKSFVFFLTEKGYIVETVLNGQDGVAIIEKENFDLVLLDEMMPGLDGLSTLQEIKKIKPNIKVVMVTQNEEEGLMEKAIAYYIDDYLIKPINPNQIIMTIKKLFKTNEIIFNKAGQDYTSFVNDISHRLQNKPDWNEWIDIYKKISKWDILNDELNDEFLKQTHFLQKRSCNSEFSSYIENNYQNWLKNADKPVLSFDLFSKYVVPEIEKTATVYFVIIDCLRYDQYLYIEPFIRELFDIDLNLYYSILPTATPYSRNSIFSGLLPVDIAKKFPSYWINSDDTESSRNRNEHQLLKEYIDYLGIDLNPPSKYTKICDAEEGNSVIRKIASYKKERLVVLVYNFLDMITHHLSKDQILQATIPDDQAFRNFTRHWFLHSSLYDTLKSIAAQGATLILSSDHGSIKVNRVSKVIGDKDATSTIRYKQGRNLSCSDKHVLYIKNPNDFGLPIMNITDNYIVAKDDYFFVYPNQINQYQKQYVGTFQHGGISMEEMLLPIAVCKPI